MLKVIPINPNYYTSKKLKEFEHDIISNIESYIDVFYKFKIVNSKTVMVKIIDKYLDEIVNALDWWPCKKRNLPLKQKSHKGVSEEFLKGEQTIHSNRREEIVCQMVCTLFKEEFLDYQVPLSPGRTGNNSGYGKIDLVSFDGKIARLIELKKYESDESIARAMLECCAYFKQLNMERFKKEYNIPEESRIIPTIAVPRKMINMLYDKEYNDAYLNLYKKLNEKFNLEILEYTYNDQEGLSVNNNEMTLVNEIKEIPFKQEII